MTDSLIEKFCALELEYDANIGDIIFQYKELCKEDRTGYCYSAGRLRKLEDFCEQNFEKRKKDGAN